MPIHPLHTHTLPQLPFLFVCLMLKALPYPIMLALEVSSYLCDIQSPVC